MTTFRIETPRIESMNTVLNQLLRLLSFFLSSSERALSGHFVSVISSIASEISCCVVSMLAMISALFSSAIGPDRTVFAVSDSVVTAFFIVFAEGTSATADFSTVIKLPLVTADFLAKFKSTYE